MGKVSERKKQARDLAVARFDEMLRVKVYSALRRFVCHQCLDKDKCVEPCPKAMIFMRLNLHNVAISLTRWN